MFGNNVKVHFAGSDGQPMFFLALDAADVSYRLYSCYKFILDKKPGDNFAMPKNSIVNLQAMSMKHVIQDSGLFTLMFGAGKGQRQTRESLTVWQDKLIEFVQQNPLKSVTCVEIDCQKVLGVEDAWFFRERMKRLLPNRQINVFHIEDGQDGLNRLIDFSDYIAISVPELRIAKPKTFREDVYRLSCYIKSRKPEIDIHLLGCTDLLLLKRCRFCTSSDSTSWLSGVKYGFFPDHAGARRHHVKAFRNSVYQKREDVLVRKTREFGWPEWSGSSLTYMTRSSLCASISKTRYEKATGPQD